MIDSCICFKKSFRRILKEANENGIDSLADLQNISNICNKCCMCNPYLEYAFATNQVEFPIDFFKNRDRLN